MGKVIRKTNIPWMGEDGYAVSPYRGCDHKCNWPGAECWFNSIKKRFNNYEEGVFEIDDFSHKLHSDITNMPPGICLVSNTTDPYQSRDKNEQKNSPHERSG